MLRSRLASIWSITANFTIIDSLLRAMLDLPSQARPDTGHQEQAITTLPMLAVPKLESKLIGLYE